MIISGQICKRHELIRWLRYCGSFRSESQCSSSYGTRQTSWDEYLKFPKIYTFGSILYISTQPLISVSPAIVYTHAQCPNDYTSNRQCMYKFSAFDMTIAVSVNIGLTYEYTIRFKHVCTAKIALK